MEYAGKKSGYSILGQIGLNCRSISRNIRANWPYNK